MDAIASGRVPVELKKQGAVKLEALNATVTDLINAAYKYLVDTGQLPVATTSCDATGKRAITPERASAFKAYLDEATIEAPEKWAEQPYEDLRYEAMQSRYGKEILPDKRNW